MQMVQKRTTSRRRVDARGRAAERGVEGAPDMVVEVVSPSSANMDYFTKAARYQQAGVVEYWIVDPSSRYTTVYRFAETGKGFMNRYAFEDPAPVLIWRDGPQIRVADFA